MSLPWLCFAQHLPAPHTPPSRRHPYFGARARAHAGDADCASRGRVRRAVFPAFPASFRPAPVGGGSRPTRPVAPTSSSAPSGGLSRPRRQNPLSAERDRLPSQAATATAVAAAAAGRGCFEGCCCSGCCCCCGCGCEGFEGCCEAAERSKLRNLKSAEVKEAQPRSLRPRSRARADAALFRGRVLPGDLAQDQADQEADQEAELDRAASSERQADRQQASSSQGKKGGQSRSRRQGRGGTEQQQAGWPRACSTTLPASGC
jgi:hypothetical protein